MLLCVFFNDTATAEIYTLSLHDALPISITSFPSALSRAARAVTTRVGEGFTRCTRRESENVRSEEHTSEPQTHVKLVCRLLPEKKNCSGISSTWFGFLFFRSSTFCKQKE